MFNDYLLDEDFLLELDNSNEKEISIKIIALSKDEMPVETIEGRATGGSINIDGTSAIRRTCSLTLVAEDINIDDYYWGLKNKFKLEIGLKNNINPKYPDIVWFKMGTYVITAFNTSQNVNSYTINISGKDKMCLLNGDLAGKLPHTTDFGMLEEIQADGSIKYIPLKIQEIIFKAVQELGGEFAHNIIINDLEDQGLELLEYRGDVPLYFFKNEKQDNIKNMTIDPNQKCFLYNSNTKQWDQEVTLQELNERNNNYDVEDNFIFDNSFNPGDNIELKSPTKIKLNKNSDNIYTIIKNTYGSIAGYRETPLVYAGTLVGEVGESLTSILDKIINMLGEFEYFYNLDGKFVFQKKPYSINAPWSQLNSNNKNEKSLVKSTYNFTNNKLIASFSNNPNLLNVKNDYSVWGVLKTSNGLELPIHARYAIDKKPKEYKTFRWSKILEKLNEEKEKERLNALKEYNQDEFTEEEWSIIQKNIEENLERKYQEQIDILKNQNEDKIYSTKNYDWRELIYQMALDYNRCYSSDDNFYYNLMNNNSNYFNGKTGYEQYYVDMLGFWRELYNPYPTMEFDSFKVENRTYEQVDVKNYLKPCMAEDFKGVDFLDKLYIHKEYVENLISSKIDIPTTTTFIPFYDFCKLTKELFKLDEEDNVVFTDQDALYYWFTDEGNMNQGTKDLEVLRKIDIKNLFVDQSELDKMETKIIYTIFGVRDPLKIGNYLPFVTAYQDKRTFLSSDLKVIFKSGDKSNILTKNNNLVVLNDPRNSEKKLLNDFDGKRFLIAPEIEKILVPNTEDQNRQEEALVWGNKIKYVWKYFLFLKKHEENLRKKEFLENNNFIYRSFYIKNIDEQKNIELLDEVVKKAYEYGESKKISWQKTDNWGESVFDENGDAIAKSENIIYLYGYYKFNRDSSTGNYWAKQIEESPETLIFWFDFLDAEQSELGKFSVPMIGSRTNPIKDDDVKTIYYRNIPNIIFRDKNSLNDSEIKTGYAYINLQNNMQGLFTISSKGKSAKEKIDELLYKHTCCAESINISTIPVYYLETNQKIAIKNDKSNINGEYIIDKLSYSLSYNGMMSITATKIYDNLF